MHPWWLDVGLYEPSTRPMVNNEVKTDKCKCAVRKVVPDGVVNEPDNRGDVWFRSCVKRISLKSVSNSRL